VHGFPSCFVVGLVAKLTNSRTGRNGCWLHLNKVAWLQAIPLIIPLANGCPILLPGSLVDLLARLLD